MEQLSLFASAPSTDGGHTSQEHSHWTMFIDGASRRNPGPSGAGIYILKNSEFHTKKGFFLGTKTNNQAEYYALLLGLFVIKKNIHMEDKLRIVSDSELLVKQIKGEYKVKHPDLKPLHALGRTMMVGMNAYIVHVLRTENVEADAMANMGVDRRHPVPQDFRALLERHAITF